MPRLPEQLGRFQPLMDRLTAKFPEERFATSAEALNAIEQLL
jgi:hypothetical protein